MLKFYENNKSIAITNAKSPIASAKPAPINAIRCTLSSIDGFLAIELIAELNILPIARAAPTKPNTIKPIAMYFSELGSIIYLQKNYYLNC